MNPNTFPRRRAAWLGGLAACAALAGCGTLAPGGLPPGTPIAQARGALFAPTGEYALPDGGTRLEFAQGSFGKQTYMLDFDRSGRLVTSQQVLTELNLATITPGMTAEQVRMRFGRPAWVFGVNYPRGQVWNYRFDGGDCVWYQVSIADADHRVVEANVGTDPACDGPNSRD
ncbi:hypothetical protein [Rhizobacter sp. Root404]|uniref:hypothetical protein n=1 Tax=Rhizobacter sp. Root404 TaxID=1736528 RepID=UPI0006FDC0C9|nr:hypothetical protein [Rhizobacter sp. Root404]KQW37567.1 hypothetical protein ASC76_05480 [Rhizobacter sp. Root404]